MTTVVPTFDAMPQMMVCILEKLDTLEKKIENLQAVSPKEEDVWFSVKDLCEYLPNHPAEQTVYGWTSKHLIPFYKNGKCITFRKSEIDEWRIKDARKSVSDMQAEALAYVANNPMARKEVKQNHG